MNETQAVDLLLAGETVYTDTPAEYGAIARELRRQDDREFYHLSSVQNVQCCEFRIVWLDLAGEMTGNGYGPAEVHAQ
jgi:hypothetical protein